MNFKTVAAVVILIWCSLLSVHAQVEIETRARFDEYHLFNDANQSSRIRFSEKAKFASAASRIVGTYEPSVTDRSPESLAKSAMNLLSMLGEDQRKTNFL